MSSLDRVVTDFINVNDEFNKLKKRKSELRTDFLDGLAHEGQETLSLPTRSTSIPADFLATVGLTEEEFLESRFPAWKMTHRKVECDEGEPVEIVYILERRPEYVSRSHRAGDKEVAKIVTEATPSLDFQTLEAEDQKLFEEIADWEVVYTINDEKLERVLLARPEVAAQLVRHLKVDKPIVKVQPKKVKNVEA